MGDQVPNEKLNGAPSYGGFALAVLERARQSVERMNSTHSCLCLSPIHLSMRTRMHISSPYSSWCAYAHAYLLAVQLDRDVTR